jgi:hypothetical protein
MDMREASAMTEASGLTDHPDVPDTAKVLDPRLPAASLSAQLRKDDGGSSATVALVGIPAGSLGSPSALGAANDRIADSMPRKLKTFQTSLGFYDLAIAVPSMKAALEAWGAGSNLFH